MRDNEFVELVVSRYNPLLGLNMAQPSGRLHFQEQYQAWLEMGR